MSAFTPGPWKYIDATKSAKYKFSPSCIIRGNGYQIASFSWNDNSPHWPNKVESQANARLIAASPELYGAIDCAVFDLYLLLLAIQAGDPSGELEIRVSDTKSRLSAALSKVKG